MKRAVNYYGGFAVLCLTVVAIYGIGFYMYAQHGATTSIGMPW